MSSSDVASDGQVLAHDERQTPTPSGDLTIPAALVPYADGLLEFHESACAPCTYFLVSRGTVVYVGQTINLASRIGEHRQDKLFDRVFHLPTPRHKLDRTERHFIEVFKPKYNFNPKRKEEFQRAKEEAAALIQLGFIHEPDPDLAAVIAAWDRLPEAVRAGIVAMVQAASQ